MAVGDTSYTWLASGSATASDDEARTIFGDYGGLSDLNASAVVHIQLMASGANFMLLPTDGACANQAGQYFKEDISAYVDLPAMRRTIASELAFANLTAGDNAVARWIIWERDGL